MHRFRSWRWSLSVALPLLAATSAARGQETVSVMVDESATAAQLLDRIDAQRVDNVGESARLADRLLREFPDRLVPASGSDPDLFRAVRHEVEARLRADAELAAAFVDLASFRATRSLERGDLETAARTALWTPAGLEAALRLAQADAEAGRGARSLRRLASLEGHPGLDDPATVARRTRLENLARWVAGGDSDEDLGTWPEEDRSRSPFDATAADPPGDGWAELWRDDLPQSPYERAFRELRRSGRPLPRTAERVVADGSLLVVMPSVDDDLVLLNEGHLVRAIDRLSRRERWRTAIDGAGNQGLGAIGDPTVVSGLGDRVVTLSGHALGNQRTGSGRVVCLDRGDGRIRWATDLAEVAATRIDDDVRDEGLYPYGVVALGADAAFVAARRVTNRLETIDYLASLDLDDGSLRWLVPLGSCGGVRLGGTRPYAAPRLDRGRVLVESSVGVVASIDAGDGSVAWLRREEVPLREGRYASQPWEISQPLPIGDRIWTVSPDQSAILELDEATGMVLARHETDAISAAQPRYLLGAVADERPLVLAIGGDVVAYDADDPTTPRWRYAERNRDRLSDEPGVVDRSGIRGRVHVVGETLLVPGIAGLRVVDLRDGRILRTLDWSEAANVVSADGQLVAIAKDSVGSIMDPAEARTRLEARRRAAPTNPEWAIALLDLEFACGRAEEAVRIAELALAAVEASGDETERDRLFDRLLAVDAASRSDRDLGPRVRDLLAAIATTPPQRVRERLSRGDWHDQRGESAEAVEVWQSLLSDAELSRQPVTDGGRIVTARIAARERMRTLAEVRGRSVLAPGAALAELRLDRLLEAEADPEALLAIAREYPLSDAAGRARREAAARFEAEGRNLDGLLARLADLRSDADAGRDASADAIAAIRDAGRARLAADLERLRPGSAATSPRLGRVPGIASEWPGRLVREATGIAVPGDPILIADENEMHRLRTDGEEIEIVWSVPIEDATPTIVGGDSTLLLWQDSDRRNPIAMAVEPETGEVSWLNPSIGATFTGMGGGGDRNPRSIAGSADGWREARDEIVPGVVEDLLVPVRRNGDLVAIEAADGTTIRWTLENLMDVVQHVEHGPLGVMLAGESRGDDGSTIPVIALVTSDGEVARRWELDAVLDREIRWIRQSPLGEVVWGTSDGIAWRGLRPGDGSADERWSLRRPHLRESWEAWTPSGRLMVRERSDRISSWRRRDGLPLAEIGDAATDGPVDAAKFEQLLETGDGRAAAIYGDRIHMLDRVGATLGLDAVHADRNYLLGAVAEDGAVVLSFEGAGPVADANGTPRTEFTYAIYRFGIEDGGRQLGPALELRTLGPRFDTMRLREGWILLSSPASTVAIPLR